jgi:ribosome maturation factor RimP
MIPALLAVIIYSIKTRANAFPPAHRSKNACGGIDCGGVSVGATDLARDNGFSLDFAVYFCYTSKLCEKKMGGPPIFCLWQRFAMDLQALLETTLAGLGYELVDLERSGRGRLLRVFIDKADGVNVDDCAAVSHHLSRVLTVEGIAYDRLEVSSPGLDRSLKKERDFVRFAGQKARIKLRVPVDGQRNFVGVLRETRAGTVQLEIDGKLMSLDLDNLEKARLVPAI